MCKAQQFFFFLIDESTDICEKTLGLVARYQSEDFSLVDDLLSLLTVKEATAQSLYSMTEFFRQK